MILVGARRRRDRGRVREDRRRSFALDSPNSTHEHSCEVAHPRLCPIESCEGTVGAPWLTLHVSPFPSDTFAPGLHPLPVLSPHELRVASIRVDPRIPFNRSQWIPFIPPLRGPTRSDPRRSIPCPRFIGIFGKDIDRLLKGIEGGGFISSPFADPRLLRACTSSGFSRRFRTSFRPFRLVRRVLGRVLGWRQVERAPLRISCAGSAANA